MMVVRFDPAVPAPPSVAYIAPAPWIVTDLASVIDSPVPVHIQVPAGITTVSPSSASVSAVCTSIWPHVRAVIVLADATEAEEITPHKIDAEIRCFRNPTENSLQYGPSVPLGKPRPRSSGS